MTSHPQQVRLIQQLKDRHEAGFEELYRAYGEDVYRLAYRMIGNHEEARDVAQETFLQVYRSIDGFREESQLSTWIFTIARNLCYRISQRRQKTTFTTLEALIQNAQKHDIPLEITKAERLYLIDQVKEGCLLGVLRCLSFSQRIAFVLHVLVRLPVKEVAKILDKSEGATKVLVHRARKNLKKFLCQHCSLYDSANACHCENLIGFSLKQGWITQPLPEILAAYNLVSSGHIEEEIDTLKKLSDLYSSLPTPSPPATLREHIRQLLEEQALEIFSSSHA
jgi:RNA polymerase sigma-70 factor (ECF subfamily)